MNVEWVPSVFIILYTSSTRIEGFIRKHHHNLIMGCDYASNPEHAIEACLLLIASFYLYLHLLHVCILHTTLIEV